MKRVLLLILIVLLSACAMPQKQEINKENLEVATFAGGCFWCIEHPLENREGIKDVVSGFAGGEEENPTYSQVASGSTGHVEAVQVFFDPQKTTYKDLLNIFWRQIDPTDDGGQFADRGFQYTTAIFYHNEEQKKIAEESLKELEESGKYDSPIVTRVVPFTTFFKAEEYHQDYAEKNPIRYGFYFRGSGRAKYLDDTWGKGNH